MLRFFALIFTLALASESASAQFATARAVVEGGANAYLKEGASGAVQAWIKGSALEGNTQAVSQANSLRQIEDFYGKPESYEVVSESSLSKKSALILFVINYQKGAVYVRFQCYQLAAGNWVSTEFKFATDATQLFPNSSLYGRQ